MTSQNTSLVAANPPRQRDAYLDNAKVLLLILVVVGHLLAVVSGSGFSEAAYKWIYSFHMPAFVVITGYLSRSYRGTPNQIRSLVSGVLVPYLVFQVVVRVEPWLLFGEPLHLNFFVPAWSNWFLLALFAWRLLVPVLQKLRFALLFSVIIALLSVIYGGIDQGLSGARILSYLPFFVLGLSVTPEHLERFKRIARMPLARIAAAGYVSAVAVGLYLAGDRVQRALFMMSGVSAIKGDFTNLEHVVLRLAIMTFTTSMLVAILILVPQRRLFFTYMGSATLTMYLLQEATLLIPRHYIAQWDGWTAPTVLLLMVAGVLYALLLGTRPVQYLTKWIVDPIGTFAWLRKLVFKPDEAAVTTPLKG